MISLAHIYEQLWLWTTVVFCLYQCSRLASMPGDRILRQPRRMSWSSLLYTIIFSIITGFRPCNYGHGWADTENYAQVYRNKMASYQLNDTLYSNDARLDLVSNVDLHGEWLWNNLENIFAHAQINPTYWFLLWSVVYIGFIYLATKKIFPRNQWVAMLFFIGAWFFTAYAYNGIRNGVACSMLLYAFTFLIKRGNNNLIKGLLIGLLAMGIHRSIFLPLVCIFIATRFNISFKTAFKCWIFSIVISLAAGAALQSFFANLGFDDRMTSYAGTTADKTADAQMFSSTGFRWDFVLYSLMPIVLGYIVLVKRRVFNRTYVRLLVTYMLANSFWIIVIRAAYSNRFAQLSWFMLPLVMAYPLLKMHVWRDQDKKVALILFGYIAFTFFMEMIYW